MKLNRRLIIIVLSIAVAAFVVAALAFIVLRHLESTHAKVARIMGKPIPVEVVRVGAGTVDEALASEGTAKEIENVPLSALTTGKVIKINTRLGDLVRKGQRLIELDPVPLVAQLKAAQEQLQASKGSLAINTRKAAAMQELFDKQLVVLDELNTALLNKLRSEEAVAQNENAVVQASVNLEAARIDSPVSGIVIVREVYADTIVKGQTPIMTVAQTDPVLVQAPYTEDKIRHISIGQAARVSFYAFPGQLFEGKVRWINPTIDSATRLMTVQVLLANPHLKLQPGMRGIVWLDNRRTSVLRVPSVALLSTNEDFAYVFVVDSDRTARIRKIRTGAYAEGYMEVKSGLQAGEEVVVVGQSGLLDSDRVRINYAQKKPQ